ncbi:MAG: alpha-N-acetylglucosaminidase C-terminal domain-containing protein [Clostridia bacterium]|nr:alpha-N-acetylglucosaminidase C-terminal domain-containing protein [Clostridia bacterium]
MIKELILRRTPEWADSFVTETAESENTWSYEPAEGKVLIKGGNAVDMSVAYYAFLRDNCGGYFDVDHALKVGEFKLPEEKKEGVIEKKYRICFEYTAFSCAACWWSWERWENEIDFMAMNGVNMPLSVVGTEAVWLKTMKDLGIKEDLALAGISGPAFWGWQLYNCFDGYLPQSSAATVDKRIELGRKIIEREKQLGMTPVMHGYSGYISRNFIQSKIRVRVNKTDEWCLFPKQYHIIVRDTTFHRIGTLYYRNLGLLLGEGCYFLADPFTAHEPAKRDSAFLAGVGAAIYKLISDQDENAVWVVHSSSVRDSMFRAVPKENVLIIGSKEESESSRFEGFEFVVGSQFNNADVTSIHGDFNAVSGVCASENTSGVGVFSDGAYSNEAFRQFSYSAMSGAKNVDSWLETYAKNRYRTDKKEALEALQLLKKSCWREGQPVREHGSAICTRPTTLLRHTSVGDSGNDIPYDIADVFAAAKKLLEAQGKTYEYELDVCDALRQALSDLANTVCKKALEGYKTKNVEQFETNSNLFLSIIEDMDRLLMTKKEFALPHYLELARSFGNSPEESENFEINILAQITSFGPIKDSVLYDMCWKEWAGVLNTFYAKRWRAFFETLAANFKKLRRLPEKTKTQVFDRDAYLGSDFGISLSKVEKAWIAEYAPENEFVGKEDTLLVANELVAKYAANF